MLASIALVGCTSDDLIENGGLEDPKKPQAELVRGDAYVNFVINTKTDSSRGITTDGTGNSGDIHEGADDSKHHVVGVRNENDVNEVLVVITKVADTVDENKAVNGYVKDTNNGMASLYTTVKDGSDGLYNGYIVTLKPGEGEEKGDITVDGTKVTMNEPIRLDYTGNYAIAVVVNPVAQLKTDVNALGANHQKAYQKILEFAGGAYETLTTTNEDGSAKMSFQMSNKNEIIVNAKPENNRPENPAKPESPVEVERTVSKATWRWTAPLTDAPTDDLKKMNNLYPVTVKINTETPETAAFWYKKIEKDGETAYDTYYYSKEFHKATTVGDNPTIYWVLFKEKVTTDDGVKTLTYNDYLDEEGKIIVDYVEAIFTDEKETEKYKGVIDDTNEDDEDDENNDQNVSSTKVEIEEYLLTQDYDTAVGQATEALVQSLTFVYKTNNDEPATKTYYVNLTHYALTNLTQKVYAVRHIQNESSMERQFGILANNKYLITPYYKGEDTFTQDITSIKNEAAAFANGVTTGSTFAKLPTANSDGDANTTHGTTDKDGNSVTYSNVGGFMQYLYENSCTIENAKAETVTGIVLAGDIYDETGNKVDVLYKYNHRFFRTLQALLEDEANKDIPEFANLTPNSTDDDVKAAGIDIYPEGRCFYYSAQIKHFDDGIADNIGVMEYAIMRNNIYSLGVKSIKEIGDATLNLTPNTPISDIRSYVELEVSILPWIVRFNDLEL